MELIHSGRRVSLLVLALMAAESVACNNLLDVQIPGSVQTSDLDNPALAPVMVSSALGEFECALGQYVTTTGILTGEYIVSGFSIGSNYWGWRGDAEIRATPGECNTAATAGNYGYYTPLQRARFLAEDGAKRIAAFPDGSVPNKSLLLAQLAAYEGYSLTLLGEGFCNMVVDGGPLMTKAQVFTQAETRFTDAIGLAQTAGNSDILNMSYVGRARVRMDLGKTAQADQDALLVPAGYVHNATYSNTIPRRYNRVFTNTVTAKDMAVAVAYRGLTVGTGAADTRVGATDAGVKGGDGVTQQWNQTKFPATTSPIAIASWREAQLIIAEVEGGQAGIDAVNRVRTAAGLPAMTPAEEANMPAQVIEERRRTLFSEGQRYGDMFRYNIPFPTGTNHKGQPYGIVTCVPIPDIERLNNPNLIGTT